MARRVFLHVGTMKAATTYLQEVLDQNHAALAEAGWLWHGMSFNRRAVGDLIGGHVRFAGDEGTWAQLAREIRSHDGDAVISMELLAPIGPKRLERVAHSLGPAELHMILTARELSRVIVSQWQEVLQNRRPYSFRDYVEGVCADASESKQHHQFWRAHDLPRIIEAWSAIVPLERTHLVTVPASGGDPVDVWRRFASVLGLNPDDYRQPARQNESLGAHSAELVRRVNALSPVAELDQAAYIRGMRRGLGKGILAARAKSEPRLVLPPEQHDWVRARADRMLAEIKDMGVHVAGDLADLVPPAEPHGETFDPSAATDGELLAAAMDGLAGMGVRLGELQVQYEQLMARNIRLRRALEEAGVSPDDVQDTERPWRRRAKGLAERSRAGRWSLQRAIRLRNTWTRRR